MKRVLLAASFFVLLAGLMAAQEETPEAPYQSRRAEFTRDADLLEAFIEGSLQLAQEDDPLRRAEVCNTLADKLTQEIQLAAEKKSAQRMVELGDLMQSLLVRGVADNLERAKKEASKEETRQEITRVAESSAQMTAPLELSLKKAVESLKAAAEKDAMIPALEALTRARMDVESASTGKGRSKGKGKGKKKS